MTRAFNVDCMDPLRVMSDNEFDLAVIDPPYGIDVNKMQLGPGNYKSSATWDSAPPEPEYFTELFRVSRNQIIFGANHFIDRIPFPSPGWIVWDKQNGDNDYAAAELAWTSFDCSLKMFRYNVAKRSRYDTTQRFHVTQKPIDLYRWIYKNFTNPNDKILDTHLGSGSSRIAAHIMNRDFTGYEINADYFEQAEVRFKHVAQQGQLFFPDTEYVRPPANQLFEQ